MVKGIDISSNNKVINWSEVAAQTQCCYIKATQGGTYVNPDLESSVQGCLSAGIHFGFYHFAGSEHTAKQEFVFFKSVISKYEIKTTLKPVLDYEVENTDYNYINEFMSFDNNLLFYSSHSVADNTRIPKNNIWIAEPDTSPSNLKGYAGIQFEWHGKLNGIIEDVDMNLFSESILRPDVSINFIKESVKMLAIKQGENSSRVKLVQGILNVFLGINLNVDGIFGNATFQAVQKYQSILHLEVDGIIGEETINTLLSDLKSNWFKA